MRLHLLGLNFFMFVAVSALSADKKTLEPGLLAHYSGGGRSVSALVPTPNFSLEAGESIHPQVPVEFSATYSGFIRIQRKGKYTFSADAKLLIDGQEAQGREVELSAGIKPLRIEYARKPGPARLQLLWQCAEMFSQEPVPGNVLGHQELPAEYSQWMGIERGRNLAEEHNCAACHKAEGAQFGGRMGPDLSQIGARTSSAWLAKWLENPKHYRASTAMPAMLENKKDSTDVAAWLATLGGGQKAAEKKSDPSGKKGKALFEKIGCLACHGDGGSSLDGVGSKYSVASLAAYLLDPLKVDKSGRMPSLLLNDVEALQLAEFLIKNKKADFEAPVNGDAVRGKTLVESSGCLSCHTIDGVENKSATAAAFAKIDAAKGCLSDAPPAKAPRYAFSQQDRESLRAFAASFQKSPDSAPAPVHAFYRQTGIFGCVKCHELDHIKQESDAVKLPVLTGAGEKLRTEWIDDVLTRKVRIRPWLEKRMPHYGEIHTKELPSLFAAVAGAPRKNEPLPATPSADAAGPGLAMLGQGKDGLGCVACHDVHGEKPSVLDGARGPEMTSMAKRLRGEWFARWMHDPQRILPGTTMPQFFADMPEKESAAKVEALWRCLLLGETMPKPERVQVGMTVAGRRNNAGQYEAAVVRTYMPGSGKEKGFSRGIAVQLSEDVAYCFDAASARLTYAWSGGFLDMKPVWGGRGGGMAKVVGQKFFTAPDTPPLRMGSAEKEPQIAFLGYQIVKKIPEFMYTIDGRRVHELITTPEKGLGLVRTFTIDAGAEPVFFVTVESPEVNCELSGAEWQTPGKIAKVTGKPDEKTVFSVTIMAKDAAPKTKK